MYSSAYFSWRKGKQTAVTNKIWQDHLNCSQKSKSVAGNVMLSFYIGKIKRILHDKKTEYFKTLTPVCHASAVADHSTSTSRNIKWDDFKILASGQCDLHC